MVPLRHKVVGFVALAVVLCAVLAYFVKPKAPLLEVVTPDQELTTYQTIHPGDTGLAERMSRTSGLAMVLMHDKYNHLNITSLENIRSWARSNFQADPNFLHPSSLSVSKEKTDTVFGALAYNMFGSVRYWLQEKAGEFLRYQIMRFHYTSEYVSFSDAYFDMFGTDADTATLLARYQTDRAKLAVDCFLWAFAWSLSVIAGIIYVALDDGKTTVFQRIRVFLGLTWALVASSYFITAWSSGDASTLISFLFAGGLSAYLLYPMARVSHQEGGRQWIRIELSPRWVSLAVWLTYSVFAIQIITWIRSGMPATPDPITLLLCSLSGDFIHDPVSAKRMVAATVGVTWIISALWAVYRWRINEPTYVEPQENFRSLEVAHEIVDTVR